MRTFTVAGHEYQSGKMGAMQQFHVSRRLAPVFTALAEAFKAMQFGDEGEVLNPEAILEPLMLAIGGLSDADSEFVINSCLDMVQRHQGTLWSRIRAGNRLMFEDIGMGEMMQIAFAVLQDNFASFFSGLPQQSTPAIPA